MSKIEKCVKPRDPPSRRNKLEAFFISKEPALPPGSIIRAPSTDKPPNKRYNTRSQKQMKFEKGSGGSKLAKPQNKLKKNLQAEEEKGPRPECSLSFEDYLAAIQKILAGFSHFSERPNRLEQVASSFYFNCCVGPVSLSQPLISKKYSPARVTECIPQQLVEAINDYFKNKQSCSALFIKHSPGCYASTTVQKVCESVGYKPIVIDITMQRIGRNLYAKLYESTQSRSITANFFQAAKSQNTVLIFKNADMALRDDENFIPTLAKLIEESKAPMIIMGKEFVEINTVARIKNIEVPPRDPADTRSILFGVFIFEIISSLIDLPPTHPDFASDLKQTCSYIQEAITPDHIVFLQKIIGNLSAYRRGYLSPALGDVQQWAFALRSIVKEKMETVRKQLEETETVFKGRRLDQQFSISGDYRDNSFLRCFASFPLPRATLMKQGRKLTDFFELEEWVKKSQRISLAQEDFDVLQEIQEKRSNKFIHQYRARQEFEDIEQRVLRRSPQFSVEEKGEEEKEERSEEIKGNIQSLTESLLSDIRIKTSAECTQRQVFPYFPQLLSQYKPRARLNTPTFLESLLDSKYVDILNYKFPFTFGSFKQQGLQLIKAQRMQNHETIQAVDQEVKEWVSDWDVIEQDEQVPPTPEAEESEVLFYNLQ